MQTNTCVNNTIVDSFGWCPDSNDTFCTQELWITERMLESKALTVQAKKFCLLTIVNRVGTSLEVSFTTTNDKVGSWYLGELDFGYSIKNTSYNDTTNRYYYSLYNLGNQINTNFSVEDNKIGGMMLVNSDVVSYSITVWYKQAMGVA